MNVLLTHGFVDASGVAHKEVELRVPIMRDETIAERAAAKAGFDTGSSYFACAMIAQCIVSWKGIALVSIDHVLELRRADVLTLQSALNQLEAADQLEESSKNSSGGEP